jgi:DnaJ-class molecular chaperone
LETTIELGLRDVYDGGKKAISLQVEDVCPRCRGTGTENMKLCPQCHGTGRILIMKKFEVSIPKGIGDGQRIRLAAQGGVGLNGGPTGDLYLVVKSVEDPTYKRKGDDLYVDLPVSIYDLLLDPERPSGDDDSRRHAEQSPAATFGERHAARQGRRRGRPIRTPDRAAPAKPQRQREKTL